jgi:hypothetical protein
MEAAERGRSYHTIFKKKIRGNKPLYSYSIWNITPEFSTQDIFLEVDLKYGSVKISQP